MKIYWHEGSKNVIGSRVKKARHMFSPALTQENLSAKLELMNVKLDRISISRIESGDRFVADYEVIAIAKALNVSLDWLLLGN
ncbi:helix-turn-helix domain-containing protein [Clostridium sp. WILCCON 0269]|uniref:Helix-turn-helix domain-containing protein n=1 Tax=Candidatus Clostridium eludens TaxID=3381663 RepID=A0ABW8SHI3_9CLOT